MKLAKSLNLKDIVLLNVTAIIGLRWISLAAVGGNTSISLWILALLLFFIPQAYAVMNLTKRMPGEGGIYLWTKEAFGNFHGFISGWCYWTNNLLYFPNLLVYIAGISVFVVGDGFQHIGENKAYIILFSLITLWGVMFFNYIGLRLGKWVHNIGGIGTWLTGTVLIIFGIISVIRFGIANPMSANSFFSDILTFDKLYFWASICFGFTGLELASILAGEIKNPEKTIPRATIISGSIVAVIYVLGTFSLLVAIPKGEINIISGFLQGIAAMGNKIGLGWMSNILALLITLGGIGGMMAWFTGAARMPFVAGIDNYLPKGFGKIHPRYGSPYIAVLIQASIASIFILRSFIGTTVREAYLVLLDTALLIYFVPYVYMFLAYIHFSRKDSDTDTGKRMPKSKPLAIIIGLSGLLTSLFAVAMSILPPAGTENIMLYEVKVIGGFFLFVFVGAYIYLKKR